MADPWVKPLNKVEELKKNLEENQNKVVVLEFMKPDNQVYKYMKPRVEKIAEEMKDKAVFYELNVNTFMKYAEKFKVEALPAFVVMKKFIKKRLVLDKDELKEAIKQVYNEIQRERESESGQANGGAGPDNNAPAKKQEVQEDPTLIQDKKELQDPNANSGQEASTKSSRGLCVLM